MQVDLHAVEEAARELYIRALKRLPPDIKEGFNQLSERESGATAREVLGTMITNIQVAESNNNLLCQDTGHTHLRCDHRPGCPGGWICAQTGHSHRLRTGHPGAPVAFLRGPSADTREQPFFIGHPGAGHPYRLFRHPAGADPEDGAQGQRLGEQLLLENGDSGRRNQRHPLLRRRLRGQCRGQDLPPHHCGRRPGRDLGSLRRPGQAGLQPALWAAVAATRKGPGWRRNCPRRSTASASAPRDWGAIQPPSPSMWSWPIPTSP